MPTPDDIAAALGSHQPREVPALPGRTNHLRAGVLVPLRWRDDRVEAVLTLRSSRLRTHAGEVSWPGGRPEPEDHDLVATAVREAREEVGARVRRILGPLSSMPLYTSDYRLEPVVAQVDPALEADGTEVERLLPVDVGALLAADAIEGLPFEWNGATLLSPVWDVGGVTVYGGTAYVLLELLTVLQGAFGVPLPPLRDRGRTFDDVMRR